MKPLILVTNDDGYDAPGIRALGEALRAVGRVVVVAPESQRSAVSHSITLHKPLRLWETAKDWWACSGSPVDSVYLGYHAVFKEQKPALVVSGINSGPNMGNDVFYSGTVAGAMEGLLLGLPSMAVSKGVKRVSGFSGQDADATDYGPAAALAVRLARKILAQGLPATTLLNVNVPLGYEPERGIRLATLGRRIYDEGAVERIDPRGRPYYWIGGSESGYEPIPGSDCVLFADGFATVTPVREDMTDTGMLDQLEDWHLEPEPND